MESKKETKNETQFLELGGRIFVVEGDKVYERDCIGCWESGDEKLYESCLKEGEPINLNEHLRNLEKTGENYWIHITKTKPEYRARSRYEEFCTSSYEESSRPDKSYMDKDLYGLPLPDGTYFIHSDYITDMNKYEKNKRCPYNIMGVRYAQGNGVDTKATIIEADVNKIINGLSKEFSQAKTNLAKKEMKL
ncbi:MAG: hypothetical protein IJ837_03845 [Clostridia bacterium]|nr:hypothetical protein [Clostridia bacterium]